LGSKDGGIEEDQSWCKHAFSVYPRCDVLMHNLPESLNKTILLVRDKPVITMME